MSKLYRCYAIAMLLLVYPIIFTSVLYRALARGYKAMLLIVHLKREHQEWKAWWDENVRK